MRKWMQEMLVLVLVILGGVLSTLAQGGTIDIDTSVTGEASNETVEYVMTLKTDQSVSITLESDEFDTYLELYDADGMLLDSNDDSDGTNSRIIFTAPSAGWYNIRVRSFNNDYPEGAYTLTITEMDVVAQMDGGRLELDQPVTTETDSALSVAYTFKASAGDVVDLIATDADEDIRMVLQGTDGDELTSDDDSGVEANPAITRYELPGSGIYTVVITAYEESTPLIGTIEMVVKSSELLLLNDEPQSVVLGADRDIEVLSLDVASGADYRITITAPVVLDGTVYASVLNASEEYPSTMIDVTGTRSFSFVFQASESGRATIRLEVYSYDETYELTVEAQAMD